MMITYHRLRYYPRVTGNHNGERMRYLIATQCSYVLKIRNGLKIEANHARSANGALYNLLDEEPPISQCILQLTNTNSFSSRRIERRTVIFPLKPRCAWLQLKLLTEFCINKWVLRINGALWISSKSEIEREGLERERGGGGGGGGEEEDMVTSQEVTENL